MFWYIYILLKLEIIANVLRPSCSKLTKLLVNRMLKLSPDIELKALIVHKNNCVLLEQYEKNLIFCNRHIDNLAVILRKTFNKSFA